MKFLANYKRHFEFSSVRIFVCSGWPIGQLVSFDFSLLNSTTLWDYIYMVRVAAFKLFYMIIYQNFWWWLCLNVKLISRFESEWPRPRLKFIIKSSAFFRNKAFLYNWTRNCRDTPYFLLRFPWSCLQVKVYWLHWGQSNLVFHTSTILDSNSGIISNGAAFLVKLHLSRTFQSQNNCWVYSACFDVACLLALISLASLCWNYFRLNELISVIFSKWSLQLKAAL